MPKVTVTGDVPTLLGLARGNIYSGTARFILNPPVGSNPGGFTSQDDGSPVPINVDVPLATDGSFVASLQSSDTVVPAGSYYSVQFLAPGVVSDLFFFGAVNVPSAPPINLDVTSEIPIAGAE